TTVGAEEEVEDIAVLAGPGCSASNGCVQILCPSNIVVISTSTICTNEQVTYTVTPIDPCSNSVNVVCMPSSGYFFPPGTTNVHCVATDTVTGDSTNCDFTVTVANTNCSPNTCVEILCPTNIVVAGCTNTPVKYFVTVVDHCGSN